jgi:uncharacterized protein
MITIYSKLFQSFNSYLYIGLRTVSSRLLWMKNMGEHIDEKKNVCLSCGACCAAYRVTFYWSEARQLGLDETFTEKFNSWRLCMAGTRRESPRCRALQGEVGREVFCNVYSRRPSPCRELQQGDDKCNRARAKYGLDPVPEVF